MLSRCSESWSDKGYFSSRLTLKEPGLSNPLSEYELAVENELPVAHATTASSGSSPQKQTVISGGEIG